MTSKAILKDKKVVPTSDLMVWAKWMELPDRLLKRTEVRGKVVSTVFLGLDHNFGGGSPLWFETMVFPEAEICRRYETYDEALAGHDEIVAAVDGDK